MKSQESPSFDEAALTVGLAAVVITYLARKKLE